MESVGFGGMDDRIRFWNLSRSLGVAVGLDWSESVLEPSRSAWNSLESVSFGVSVGGGCC